MKDRSGRIGIDEPMGREIDIESLVDAIDPRDDREVVYPARHPGEREFVEWDPYDWVEPE